MIERPKYYKIRHPVMHHPVLKLSPWVLCIYILFNWSWLVSLSFPQLKLQSSLFNKDDLIWQIMTHLWICRLKKLELACKCCQWNANHDPHDVHCRCVLYLKGDIFEEKYIFFYAWEHILECLECLLNHNLWCNTNPDTLFWAVWKIYNSMSHFDFSGYLRSIWV